MPILLIPTAYACFLLNWQASGEDESSAPASWTEYYLQTARGYEVTLGPDDGTLPVRDQAIFEWSSLDDYHGSVFAWCEDDRPVVVGTIFSFPLRGTSQRRAVHEFASFAAAEVTVAGPDGGRWTPPAVGELERVPNAAAPPVGDRVLRLHCRRLAKHFTARLNRRDDVWELRLLPTPLLEYSPISDDVLGGALFAFVAYSTDPEILLLLEARSTDEGPAWFFQAVRFSDKSLYLDYQQQCIWESRRIAHGGEGPDTDDPQYHVFHSEPIPPDVTDRLSAPADE